MLTVNAHVQGMEELLRHLAQAPELVERELLGAMERSVLVAEAEIVRRTPTNRRRTGGRLRNAIAHRIEGSGAGLRGIVAVANVPYAIYVETGTRPHVIQARTRRALRFMMGGQVIFRRRVNHPGTPGVHMFRDGLQAARPRVEAYFQAALRRVLDRVAS